MKEIKLLISEDAYSLLVTSMRLNCMADTAHGPIFSFAAAVLESLERGDSERSIKTREEREKDAR